jgi:hypothetical protein
MIYLVVVGAAVSLTLIASAVRRATHAVPPALETVAA